MEFTTYLAQLDKQVGAMRAAVERAGPDAPVPTCPEWTVLKLVRHIYRVHSWASAALRADPDGPAPERPQAPDGWPELLAAWDERRAALLDALRAAGPDAPAWVFAEGIPRTAAFWARRQAHEAAIHRLDAAHAVAGSIQASSVPTLVFDPGFAADGIDEAVTLMYPRVWAHQPADPQAAGTVLFHAADAGRTWLVRLRPGEQLEIEPDTAHESGLDADATVAGTADAVYRNVWGRPSTALVSGDRRLSGLLRMP